HRQEERDHDDRLRAGRRAPGRKTAGRGHLRGLPPPFPPDHDDDDGRAARRAAPGPRLGDGRRAAPAARRHHRRRPPRLPAPHALHHARRLPVSRALPALPPPTADGGGPRTLGGGPRLMLTMSVSPRRSPRAPRSGRGPAAPPGAASPLSVLLLLAAVLSSLWGCSGDKVESTPATKRPRCPSAS